MTLTKKKSKIKNKTKKNKEKKDVNKNNCLSFFNTYNTFEDKLEKVYGDIFSSEKFNLEKIDIKDLKKAVSPSNINPQNDFYSYINERWLNEKELEEQQKYIVQVDSFRLVQDKVYRELLELVNNYITQYLSSYELKENFSVDGSFTFKDFKERKGSSGASDNFKGTYKSYQYIIGVGLQYAF